MDAVEKKIIDLIDIHRDEIITFGRDILEHPELGFKEYRTADRFSQLLKKYGVEYEKGLAVTGVKGRIAGQASGASASTVALIGEMDAVKSPGHPFADPNTGAAHACGHNAQLAGVAGAAIALSAPEVRKHLGGDAVFLQFLPRNTVRLNLRIRLKSKV